MTSRNNRPFASEILPETIAITGIAGTFPASSNFDELKYNLYNKVDMVASEVKPLHPDIPKRCGRLPTRQKFDAEFFKIDDIEAHSMDPALRMVLEKSFEAILDAGMHPSDLAGPKTGVYIGASFSESEKEWFYSKNKVTGFGMTGCSRAMLANRISYWLNATGPSYNIDTACSSSLYAVHQAYRDLLLGVIDYAVVGTTQLVMADNTTLQFYRLGVLSQEGRCRTFDEDTSGYVRAEAIGVLILSRAKLAKRVYSYIEHVKTNCDGYKPQGITYPSGEKQGLLLKQFYDECGVAPESISYLECHGTGTRVGDIEEANTVDEVFCRNRKTPLKIGSVKTNLGHAEPASGVCSIAKVILAFETGYIAPNLHFENPRKEILGLVEGRMQVVTEVEALDGDLVGLSGFGFGGANCHILMRRNPKLKSLKTRENDLPILVTFSGRTHDAINTIINEFQAIQIDEELVALYHNVFRKNIHAHNNRGYALLSKNSNQPHQLLQCANEYIPLDQINTNKICFVFPGLGNQWLGMGTELLKIKTFATTIQKLQKILQELDVDIFKILSDKNNPKLFDNVLYSILGTAAIQIGMVDVLASIGLKPAFVTGFSIGQFACAYADGTLTVEQAILSAYHTGMVLLESKIAPELIAICYSSSEQLLQCCPPEVEIVGNLNKRTTLISGPHDAITSLVHELSSRRLSFRILNTSNIALNSKKVSHLDTKLRKELEKFIPNPQKRSKKWISTSNSNNNNNAAHLTSQSLCSAQNIASSVYQNEINFGEALSKIQSNDIILEISPNKMLPDLLENNACKQFHVTSLFGKDEGGNSLNNFLLKLGKIYSKGFDLDLRTLYPPVSFPVSRGTPSISSKIKWNHYKNWYVCTDDDMFDESQSGESTYMIQTRDPKYESITGHVIDGRNLYPATGYLVLTWETFAHMRGQIHENVPVVFEDVRFLRATNVPKDGAFAMSVMIQRGTGQFEVEEGGTTVVAGRIRIANIKNPELLDLAPITPVVNDVFLPLNSRDIYKELRLRGYNYKDDFKAILECDNSATVAKIEWKNHNWVTFMDNMLQLQILQEKYRFLYVPTSIERLTIYPGEHTKCIETLPDKREAITVTHYRKHGILRGGGVEIKGLEASSINRRKPLGEPVFEQQCFVPFISNEKFSLNDSLRVILQTVLELAPAIKLKVIEVDQKSSDLLSATIVKVLGDLPLIQPEVIVLSKRTFSDLPKNVTVTDKTIEGEGNASFVVDFDLVNNQHRLIAAQKALRSPTGFIISRESPKVKPNAIDGYDILIEIFTGDEKLVLLRKKKLQIGTPVAIQVTSKDTEFQWLEQVQAALKKIQTVVLFCQNESVNGLIGLANCMIKESYGEHIRCIFIDDKTAPTFDATNPFYKTQLEKAFYINILKNGQWGALRHLEFNQTTVETDHAYACVITRGDLSSTKWTELPSNPLVKVIDVYYSALNFRDVMTATGKLSIDYIQKNENAEDVCLPPDCVQGLEFSGRDVKTGKRFMGLVGRGGMATKVHVDPLLAWPVPDEWTMEQAATIPVVYGTVYYSLVLQGLKRGDSVLIHSGTGGVGLAAINVALYYGCEIFTTVGTEEKREFIKNTFPQIKDSHIGNSRDTSFEQMVMIQTKGQGVNFVLNSLAEEKLLASVRCLSQHGKFMEIGKFDLSQNHKLGMEIFLRGASFHGIMLDNAICGTDEMKIRLHKTINDGIKSGAIKPLPATVFGIEDGLEKPYRYMATGKHLGKVLLKIRNEESSLVVKPPQTVLNALPRVYCDKNKSYVIIGGLGGFGLELSNWLIERGCKKLVLSSRNGLKKGYQAICVQKWRSSGINVQISTSDISTNSGSINLLKEANKIGPVGAIFNLAVVLKDAIFENQTVENFKISFSGKALGTHHLDQVSRKLCPQLEYFVVFSSVSCGRGNAGQSNYGMANSVMERIMEKRKADGYPALAIQWGAIGDVGIVADMQDNDTLLEIGGTLQQSLNSCLDSMDILMKQNAPVVASMVVAEKKYGFGAGGNLVETIFSILGVRDVETVSKQASLAELGMDSMMAVEIKQTLEREYEVFLTAQDIRGLTFAKLMEIQALNESAGDAPAQQTEDSVNNLFRMLVRTLGGSNKDNEIIKKISSLSKNNESRYPPVFLFPGIEGNSSIFECLCKSLEQITFGLNIDFTNKFDSIETLSEHLSTQIQSKLKQNEPYYLIGYSFGSLLATEVALQLEKSGHKGKLLYLDGGPTFIKILTDQHLQISSDMTKNVIETKLLLLIMSVITTENLTLLEPELISKPDWVSRLELVFSKIPPNIQEQHPNGKEISTSILARFNAMLNYKARSNYNLHGSIGLVRPTAAVFHDIPEDYNLSQQISSAGVPVPVTFIEGDHYSFIHDPSLSDVINRFFLSEA